MTDVSYGRRGYAEFCDSMRWKNAAGEPMPHWDKLTDREREAWERQAKTIIASAKRLTRTSEVKTHFHNGMPGQRTLCGLVPGGRKTTDDCSQVTCGSCKRAK
jgi:hypothetical protein